MLQAASYLERAMMAEHKAEEASSPDMRENYLEIAKSWRNLAQGACYDKTTHNKAKPNDA